MTNVYVSRETCETEKNRLYVSHETCETREKTGCMFHLKACKKQNRICRNFWAMFHVKHRFFYPFVVQWFTELENKKSQLQIVDKVKFCGKGEV